jgi:hypothetical protein
VDGCFGMSSNLLAGRGCAHIVVRFGTPCLWSGLFGKTRKAEQSAVDLVPGQGGEKKRKREDEQKKLGRKLHAFGL